MGMERTHVFLPQPVISRLKALAEKTGLPVSELIRRAIDEYLEQLQRKADHLGAVIDQEAPHG
jgi:predicted DNA-binding protein